MHVVICGESDCDLLVQAWLFILQWSVAEKWLTAEIFRGIWPNGCHSKSIMKATSGSLAQQSVMHRVLLGKPIWKYRNSGNFHGCKFARNTNCNLQHKIHVCYFCICLTNHAFINCSHACTLNVSRHVNYIHRRIYGHQRTRA